MLLEAEVLTVGRGRPSSRSLSAPRRATRRERHPSDGKDGLVDRGLLSLPLTATVGRIDSSAAGVLMGVLVILEMDGSTDALLAAAADLEARRPTSAMLARVVAPTESGVVVATFWESAEARDAYQSQPEHREALQASGLLDAVTEMRSRVFEDAELKLT
jgi:hypothetical protein